MVEASPTFGPWDHGRPLTERAFMSAEFASGYRYELIYGRLSVIAWPEVPHSMIEQCIWRSLNDYSTKHRTTLEYVTTKAWVRGERGRRTWVQPDVAAYRNFPPYPSKLGWDAVHPCIVAEVMTADTLERDLIRKAEIYLRVMSIQEYWIVSDLELEERPRLRVHRRQRNKWEVIDVPNGARYRTELLPRFRLRIDPLKR